MVEQKLEEKKELNSAEKYFFECFSEGGLIKKIVKDFNDEQIKSNSDVRAMIDQPPEEWGIIKKTVIGYISSNLEKRPVTVGPYLTSLEINLFDKFFEEIKGVRGIVMGNRERTLVGTPNERDKPSQIQYDIYPDYELFEQDSEELGE